jgi:hypothetical protein
MKVNIKKIGIEFGTSYKELSFDILPVININLRDKVIIFSWLFFWIDMEKI